MKNIYTAIIATAACLSLLSCTRNSQLATQEVQEGGNRSVVTTTKTIQDDDFNQSMQSIDRSRAEIALMKQDLATLCQVYFSLGVHFAQIEYEKRLDGRTEIPPILPYTELLRDCISNAIAEYKGEISLKMP